MRIAYICADPGIPVFGHKRCSIHVQEIVRAFIREGAQVDLFAACVDGNSPQGLEQVRVHKLPPFSNEYSIDESAAFGANQSLRAMLESQCNLDMVYERYSMWSYAGMDFARGYGIPGLLEVNASSIEEHPQYFVDRMRAEHVADRVFNTAAALVACSYEVAAYLDNRVKDKERIHVVPNGINPDRFSTKAPTLSHASSTFTVGCMGALNPGNDLTCLLDAFTWLYQARPDSRLLIVGDGPGRDKLTEDIEGKGLSNVVYITGAVNPEEVPARLGAMDAAVIPCRSEPDFCFSPSKVFEYMATGLPVVAGDMGQIKCIIHHGVNGLLYKAGDPIAMASALGRLRREQNLRSQLGQAGRSMVLRNHTWDRNVKKLLDIANAGVPLIPCTEAV